jgi:hypothetical protein
VTELRGSGLRRHVTAVIILGLFVCLAITYSLATPLFEAPDESNHYAFIQHLSAGNGLPVQRPGVQTLWLQEGSQPPLYYVLGALLTSWIDTRDLPSLMRSNPHADIGVPGSQDNKNALIHTERELPPWAGVVLAVHIIRLFSILLSAGTVLCTYLIALHLFPHRPFIAYGAMALNATIPMFLFIGSSVNNDNLVILLASVSLVIMVRLLDPSVGRRWVLGLGIVLGLACLSKLGALGLLPLAALALAFRHAQPFAPFGKPSGLREEDVSRQPLATAADPENGVKPSHPLPKPHTCTERSAVQPVLPVAHRPGCRCRDFVTRIFDAWRGRLWAWLADSVIIVVTVILIAGWWYARNERLYGEPLGLSIMLDILTRRAASPPIAQRLLGEFGGFRASFWGVFGWFNVLMRPAWIYRALDVLAILGLTGLLIRAWRIRPKRRASAATPSSPETPHLHRTAFDAASPACGTQARAQVSGLRDEDLRRLRQWAGVFLLICWALIVFVSVVRYTTLTMASQGRLMFPALSAICVLVVLGFTAWFPYRYERAATWGLSGLMFILAASVPFAAIIPAYRPPRILTATQVPASAHPFGIDYIGADGRPAVRLLAYELGANPIQPGKPVPLTLYWQALTPTDEDFSVYLQLYGWDRGLWQHDTYPGGGSYPTSLWSPGNVIRDRYQIIVPADAAGPGPSPAFLAVGLYRLSTLEKLAAIDETGARVSFPSIPVKLGAPGVLITPRYPLEANLGNQIGLTGYDLDNRSVQAGAELPLSLYWRVTGKPDRDYKMFVHLVPLDDAERIVSQVDRPPVGDVYPTSIWQPGEVLRGRYRLAVPADTPPGTYRLYTGLYDSDTGKRLPIVDAQGNAAADRVSITTVEVVPK